MSIIGTPSFAMLLVLTNITLCLSVDAQRVTSDLRQPTTTALSPAPLGGSLHINARRLPVDGSMPARLPLQGD